jgi:alkanesulfonate monooxygenase SsuD/methylene tetrahydromethanopterin reductase-like flavin-dependent oxidoreductase (luciferase family)
MKLGVLKTISCLADGDPAAMYAEWLELAVEAERLGFWSVWTTQHKFGTELDYRPLGVPDDGWPTTDYDLAPDALALLLHLAAKTTRIRLGTGVTVPAWDHPVLVAERAAMADVLSGGRLELGVGRGVGFREAAVFGVPGDDAENRRRFAESLAIVRGLWSGGPFSFDGEFFRLPELRLVPRPMTQPAPVLVAAAGLDTAAYAGSLGLPYASFLWPVFDLAPQLAKRERHLEAAADAGMDVAALDCPHILFMHCARSDAEAEEVADRYFTQYQLVLEGHYQHSGLSHRRRGGTAAEGLADIARVTKTTIETQLIGSVETVLEKLETYRRELGLTYVIVDVGWGLMPLETTLGSLRRFAAGVLPKFAPVVAR